MGYNPVCTCSLMGVAKIVTKTQPRCPSEKQRHEFYAAVPLPGPEVVFRLARKLIMKAAMNSSSSSAYMCTDYTCIERVYSEVSRTYAFSGSRIVHTKQQ